MTMRVGIMGGTLDPVHNGHLMLAEAALKLLKLDRVMLLPAGDPPHKLPPTLKTDRLQMARIAAKGCPGLFVCNIEVLRPGTTYTVDTLRELTRNNPATEWIYLIGADTLAVIESWRCFPEVAKMCGFAVVGRPGEALDVEKMRRLEVECGASFTALPFEGPDISSSEIRARVAMGRDISEMVPPGVAAHIRRRGLYLCGKSKPEILGMLKRELKPERYAHTLGVAETAARLAPLYGIDPARAELAGLLHDCAKYRPMAEMRALALRADPPADAEEMQTASVLHAPAGSALAAEQYGVRDPEILSAIRKHTLGAAEMRAMDALIYTADFIEPNRSDFPGMAEARRLAEEDVYRAMVKCARLTGEYLAREGRRAHPRTQAMLAAYAELKAQKED